MYVVVFFNVDIEYFSSSMYRLVQEVTSGKKKRKKPTQKNDRKPNSIFVCSSLEKTIFKKKLFKYNSKDQHMLLHYDIFRLDSY